VDITATRDDYTLVAEAKGTMTSAGLDVDTAYGQLLRRMPDDDSTAYAIVVPRGAVRAALRMAEHVLAKLSISVFSVEDDGTVRLEGGAALSGDENRGLEQGEG
jgi:glutamate mutase epsilon subunit